MTGIRELFPFGAAEILTAAAGAQRILDAGCGSGRLTVALAEAGVASRRSPSPTGS